MQEESTLYENSRYTEHENGDFHSPKLLITTANMRLYRISKRGKYFLIKTTKDNSEHQLNILKREYELSIGAAHPHIVHVYTYEENLEVGPAIVMEYIEGCTLEEYLAGNISKKERNRLFEELLSAVGYLHKRGIIHNDLKPENILVTRADHSLKLIDFGLADDDSHYVLKTLGCTPHYASPELRDQSRNIDARSDIYSIGIIMQRLVGNSAIARRCCQPSPHKRYANIEALQRAWHNRHRPYLAVAAVVLLIMIILPTILLTESKNENEQQQQQMVQQQHKIEQQQQQISEQQKEQQQIKEQQHKIEQQQQQQISEQQKEQQQIKEQQRKVKKEQKVKQQQQQEALKQLEQDLALIYQRAKDSLAACPYDEFSWVYIIEMESNLIAYQAGIKDRANSPELEAVLLARFDLIHAKYLNDICDLQEQLQLPSYRDVEPKDTWPFYDSLYYNGLPYRPHPQKSK